MKIKILLKVILICIGVLLLYGVLQQFQPKNIELKATPSYFIEKGIFIPIASAMMLFTFIIISSMFLRIQKGLHYNKYFSGFIFSFSFIGFWFIGMFEPYLIFNESIYFCLFLAIIDSIALLLLGFFLGVFIKHGNNDIVKTHPINNVIRVLIVALLFTFGRYISYSVIGVYSSINTMPIQNFIWIFGIGLSAGFLYWISQKANQYSPIKKSIWFGITYFGLIWIIYNSFNPLFVKYELTGIGRISLLDLYIKTGVDITFVTLSVLISEFIIIKIGHGTSYNSQ